MSNHRIPYTVVIQIKIIKYFTGLPDQIVKRQNCITAFKCYKNDGDEKYSTQLLFETKLARFVRQIRIIVRKYHFTGRTSIIFRLVERQRRDRDIYKMSWKNDAIYTITQKFSSTCSTIFQGRFEGIPKQ